MKQIYIFFVIALTIISSYAQADIYSQYPTPDIIQCTRVSGIANQCLDDTRPQKHVIQYKDQYGQVTMQEEETYERLKCAKNQHKCTDSSGNYRGKTVISSDFFYIVYKDFYVYPGDDGADWAYKNGTGPLFGGQMAASAKPKIFQAWCNPQGDTCDVDNIAVSREKLPAHIPFSTDTSNCNLELCYNSDEDVIGLNPDYDLWKK